MFPQDIPIAPQFHPILFGHNLTSMYVKHNWSLKGKHNYTSILEDRSKSRFRCLHMPNVPEKLASMWLFLNL